MTMNSSSAAAAMSVLYKRTSRSMLLSLLLLSATATVHANSYESGTPHGKVVRLSQSTFEDAIKRDPANPLWLLKFFAPWCGHCKRLAPVLDEVAPAVKGKMAIGTIDCTVEKPLCKEFGVRGYPTLKFARDGEIYDYPGTRKKESIVEFALKMSSNPVADISTYEQAITEVASKSNNGVVFVAYHPDCKGDDMEKKMQSTHFLQVFAQVARKEQHMASFALLSPEAKGALDGFVADATGNEEKGFIVKIEENVPSVVFEFDKEADVTAESVGDFVTKQNVAIVSAIGPQNFGKLGRNGRPLVIGVVDGTAEQVRDIKKDLASFATTAPTEITSKYYFGWMDGREWHRFLDQFNVTTEELPTVLALDVPTRTYWKDDNYKTTKELVMAVEEGKVEARKAESSKKTGVMARLEHMIVSNLPYSVIILVVLAALFVLLLVPSPTDLRPPYNDSSGPTLTRPAKKVDAGATAEKKEGTKSGKDADAGAAQEDSTESKKDK